MQPGRARASPRRRGKREKKEFLGGDNLPRTPVFGRAEGERRQELFLRLAAVSGSFVQKAQAPEFLPRLAVSLQRGRPLPSARCPPNQGRQGKALPYRRAAGIGKARCTALRPQTPCERVLPDPLTQADSVPALPGRRVKGRDCKSRGSLYLGMGFMLPLFEHNALSTPCPALLAAACP